MTNREMYNEMLNVLNGTKTDGWDELAEAVEGAIAKLDATNEKRKVASAAKAAEKRAARETEREPVRKAIVEVLSEEPMTASMIIEAAGLEVKPQMIPSLMKPLIAEGLASRVEIKIVGKGKHVAYVKA